MFRRVATRRQRITQAGSTESLETRMLLSAANVQVLNRSGQSFITWNEDTSVTNEKYHIYRHNQPITNANLNQAHRITDKWGPLDDDTSIHKLAADGVPDRFVIEDGGSQLRANQGLFVYTTQSGDSGNAYYAVTQVNGSTEDRNILPGVNATTAAVSESVQDPEPVLVRSQNGGKGRTYTQFMDYEDWNPSFQGYAYNYHVALPNDYNPNQEYPLKLVLHAYNERLKTPASAEFDWQSIQVFADDPGQDVGSTHTWWYGFSEDHDYANGGEPTSGQIRNFTEERVLLAIDQVIDDADFNVDPTRIHAQGFSMGGSGALSLGVRYGNVFSSVYAASPMSDYLRDTVFRSELIQLWGSPAENLKVINSGRRSGLIRDVNNEVGVWDWTDHVQTIRSEPARDISHISLFAGKDDPIIDYQTQVVPLVRAFTEIGVSFTAELRDNWTHNFPGFSGVNHQLINDVDNTDLGIYEFRRQSLPAITRAENSGPVVPGNNGTDTYNLDIEWSVPWNDFHDPIVDQRDRYEVTLRSTSSAQTATITPRRTNNFEVVAGAEYRWENYNADNGRLVDSGSVTADSDGVVSVPKFAIRTRSGSRLVMIRTDSNDGGGDGGGGESTAEIRNGVLFVDGSSQDDTILIRNSGANTIVRTDNLNERFANADFDKVIIRTFAGNDDISVSSSKQTRVESGAGNDTVLTGKGDDTILGGSGNDTLRGRDGDDVITGGNGDDTITGDDGNDSLTGGNGQDVFFAGGGNDHISGGGDADIISADSGSDTVSGGSGRDILLGGNGGDILLGGGGEDILIGGRTSYDKNLSVLKSLRDEWNSNRDYETRVDNIRNGGGLNKTKKFNSVTVRADSGKTDSLTGGDGRDWFFREFDTLFDRQSDEERDIFE